MTESLKIITARLNLDMEGIYGWLDILSIPQQNQSQKALAVNSLYTYARQADAMIIVAPNSQHQNLKIPPTFRPTRVESGRARSRCRSSPKAVRAKCSS